MTVNRNTEIDVCACFFKFLLTDERNGDIIVVIQDVFSCMTTIIY